jgi:hypothetical protein
LGDVLLGIRFPTSPQAADDRHRMVCHDEGVRRGAR